MHKFVIAAFSAFVANAVNLTEESCDCPEMPACPMPEDGCCAKISNHYHYHYSCEADPVEATLNPVCDPESLIYNATDPACVCDPNNSGLYDADDLRCQIPFVCYVDIGFE